MMQFDHFQISGLIWKLKADEQAYSSRSKADFLENGGFAKWDFAKCI